MYETTFLFENEELLLRNTYINANLNRVTGDIPATDSKKKKSRRLLWADNKKDSPEDLATAIQEDDENPNEMANPLDVGKKEIATRSILRKVNAPETNPEQPKNNVNCNY